MNLINIFILYKSNKQNSPLHNDYKFFYKNLFILLQIIDSKWLSCPNQPVSKNYH